MHLGRQFAAWHIFEELLKTNFPQSFEKEGWGGVVSKCYIPRCI